MASSTLRQKKSDAYAALLIEHCKNEEDLPPTIVTFLMEVHEQMKLPSLEEDAEQGIEAQAQAADVEGPVEGPKT